MSWDIDELTAEEKSRLIRFLEPWWQQKPARGCCPPPGAPCVTFPDRVATLALASGNLIGYWRLGEGADPWLDTSPLADAHLSKTSAGSHHMVDDVTGALPVGQDDGAVEFTASALTQGDYLTPAVTTRFQFTNSAYTVACWVKFNSDCGAGASSLIVGTFSPSNGGWGLEAGGGQTIYHERASAGGSPATAATGPAVAAGEWVMVAATWSPSTGHQLFYNAALVDTDPGITTVPGLTLRLGAMATGGPVYGGFDGSVDELTIWSEVLSADEILSLYSAGLPCTPSGGHAGQSIVSNGDNTTSWQYALTVQTGAPSAYLTPFVFDDTPTTGGLYGWDGSAYQQVGPAP